MNSNFRAFAISLLGAAALSATCVFAAIGPARAAQAPLTRADWAHALERQISSANDDAAAGLIEKGVAEAVLTVRLDGTGAVSDVSIDRSTRRAGLDRHALRIARALHYPALPASMRGTPQAVKMRLVFGASAHEVEHYLARRPARAALYAADARPAGGAAAE